MVADRVRFGPAGIPSTFRELKKPVSDVPQFLHEEGLGAFEYQATRWGGKPQMSRESAGKLGENAKRYDTWLTVHGSYFINFCSDEKTVERSKARLIACVTAAHWMGAHVVVFHPGFYKKKLSKEAVESCKKAMREVVNSLRSLGITSVHVGPETMGKPSQFGSLDEILTICEQVEQTKPVIDWAHLHARERGRFKTADDFRKVLNEIENRLGTKEVENLHCHYTPIEFTEKGEKRHHTMNETEYGPDFRLLAKVIAESGLKPVIISESPILDIDSLRMRGILLEELQKQGKKL